MKGINEPVITIPVFILKIRIRKQDLRLSRLYETSGNIKIVRTPVFWYATVFMHNASSTCTFR